MEAQGSASCVVSLFRLDFEPVLPGFGHRTGCQGGCPTSSSAGSPVRTSLDFWSCLGSLQAQGSLIKSLSCETRDCLLYIL